AIVFCKYHKNDLLSIPDDEDEDDFERDAYEPRRSDDISEWDKEFIKQFTVEEGTLFDIIMAANYLDIKALLAVGCKTIANMVRGKNSDQVRQMFNISYDPPGEGLNTPRNSVTSKESGDNQLLTTQEKESRCKTPSPELMYD
ncbi:unnamed protein product, partial [Didymodactylos carnosus]